MLSKSATLIGGASEFAIKQESRGAHTFSKTQVQIILAAEKLFAKSGIDSVSLREIAAKAHQRNNFAVQYHFGSRDNLVRAVFGHRMLQMEEQRGSMLSEAERTGSLHRIRTLLDMIYLPQLRLLDADGNHSYANFLCQYLLRQRSQEFGDFGTPLPPHLDKILKLLRIRLGHLPNAAAQRRLVSASLVFLNILVGYGEKTVSGESRKESFDAALSDTMAQIELAICSPLSAQNGAPATVDV
jgi:AcrR family transcriptional regulator